MNKNIPGLNGIRAIAVILVIISHRFPSESFVHIFPLGNLAVDVFFVLSGFLISRILFFQIKNVDSNRINNIEIIKKFILRRSLRIFPIYYLLLFFMYFTKGTIGNNFHENFKWYFFYCANYLNYNEGKWFGALAHFWSLSVEEQFYIFWPLLLVFFFRNRIFCLICLVITTGTIYPFFHQGLVSVLTLSCINAFGIGALLAYVEIVKPNYESLFLKTTFYIFVPVLLLIIIHFTIIIIPYFSVRLAVSLLAVSVISWCRYESNSTLVKHILENKILNFIGIISYGIYLYHNVVPKYWVSLITKIGFVTPATRNEFSYFEFIIQTLFIIGVSYFSWILIEKPILNFKQKI
jgi:peptidoglycan/LPS O-acetylase OafA/YrhL